MKLREVEWRGKRYLANGTHLVAVSRRGHRRRQAGSSIMFTYHSHWANLAVPKPIPPDCIF